MADDDGNSGFDAPMLAARSGPESKTAELRGECPRRTLDVLDAVSIARDYPSRNALVNEILGEWAEKVRHEHSVIGRVLGGNPSEPEPAGINQKRGDES